MKRSARARAPSRTIAPTPIYPRVRGLALIAILTLGPALPEVWSQARLALSEGRDAHSVSLRVASGSSSSDRGLHGQLLRHHALKILRGELKPGDLIPDQLPAGLRASRTAQREAIRVLSAKGLVESRQRVGTRVRPREDWNLLDPDVLGWLNSGKPDQRLLASLVEVRALIEPFAAALAATRASKPEVQTLQETFREMEATLDVDRDAFIDADMRFHDAILAASKNELLRHMCSAISGVSVRSRQVSSSVPGANRASMQLHRAVLEGIAARKPEAAAQAMRQLVTEHGRDISGAR